MSGLRHFESRESSGSRAVANTRDTPAPKRGRAPHSILLTTLLALPLAAQPPSFSREVAPILQKHCVGCHKEGKAKGKYRLDTYSRAVEELVAGDLEESELYYRITTDDEDDRMPAETDPLKPGEIDVIRKWIEQGAQYDAGDPDALLSSIVPMKAHPAPPAVYPRPLPVTAMVFAGNGSELITGGYHELLVWNPSEGRLLRRIADNGQRTYGMALSPGGKLLAAATGSPGETGEVRVFEADSGRVVTTPYRSDDIVLAVAFDPTGDRLAVGGTDGILRVFDTTTWNESLALTAHSDWITALHWNDDGSRIATASRDKTAKVFDSSGKGTRLATFSGHSEPVRGVAFHPGGEEVISCGDDGLVLRWKVADGKKSGDLAKLEDPVLRLAASEAGYFAAGPDGLAVQFNRADQKRLREFRVDPAGTLAAGAVHASRLALGTLDGRVVLFDLETGEPSGTIVTAPR